MSGPSSFGWALLASFCWGFAPLLEKAGLGGKTDPVIGVFVRSLGVMLGALCMAPVLPKLSGRFSDVSLRHWLLLGLGGIMASIIGQLCFYRALKTGDVSRVVPVGASYPVTACLLGIFLLHETLTPAKAAGILLVVSGTFLLR